MMEEVAATPPFVNSTTTTPFEISLFTSFVFTEITALLKLKAPHHFMGNFVSCKKLKISETVSYWIGNIQLTPAYPNSKETVKFRISFG